ncbi:hypothetical protein H5410_047063 [Solanum commersonii]|uniref:Uncharacterized protein n=1 Tax=Solanum commersonii TaxID=4109 RepID=A0A9J5XG12_SOLCO|nr:hypothetical protein H5410_047063 [Solanum commersonii]
MILEDKKGLSLNVIVFHPYIIIILFIYISQNSPNLSERKIRVCVYGDGLDYYVDKFILLDTYRISTARVKVSLSSYKRLIQKIYWMLNKETLIEHVKPNDEFEKLLLPPTKLNTTTFTSIAPMTLTPTAKIDIIEVVLRCGPSKYEGRTKNRCRDVIVDNNQKNDIVFLVLSDKINFCSLYGTISKK